MRTMRRRDGSGEKVWRRPGAAEAGIEVDMRDSSLARGMGWKRVGWVRLVTRRVFEGGVGWIKGGTVERSMERGEERRRGVEDVLLLEEEEEEEEREEVLELRERGSLGMGCLVVAVVVFAMVLALV